MTMHTEYYTILGVTPDCSFDELSIAYDKIAAECNPTNNPIKLKKLKKASYAYAVLCSPEKRQIYDKGGEKAIQGITSLTPQFSSPLDIYNMYFGGFQGSRAYCLRRERHAKNITHTLYITLKDLYNGATIKQIVNKSVICVNCKGYGGNTTPETCGICLGTGIQRPLKDFLGGALCKVEALCEECKGIGECIKPKNRCPICRGEKTTILEKNYDVSIGKGMSFGQTIIFKNEGHQEPGFKPGDIIFILEEINECEFRRSGNDLIFEMSLQLVEALCGCQKVIHTLDDRDLLLKISPGEITNTKNWKYITGEGMPVYNQPSLKGKLKIKFDIIFPSKVNPIIIPLIKYCLPQRISLRIPSNAEEVDMIPF